MKHHQRQQTVNNWTNRSDEPEGSLEPEIIYESNCDKCDKEMTFHQHYVNGGLCYNCIMNIGK